MHLAAAAATARTASSSSRNSGTILLPRFVAWTAASLPLAVWVRDSLVDVCRVHGSSMEPVLRDGDILLVRKCDPGALVEGLFDLTGWLRASLTSRSNGGDNDMARHRSQSSLSLERARVLRYEQSLGVGTHAPVARLYESPPLALPGHVAIYQDPTAYPIQLNVKRVLGVGGQCVIPPPRHTSSSSSYTHRYHPGGNSRPQSAAVTVVPPYALYVEGDNLSNSLDSRQLGPIPKGLLVGIAEAIVWPPSRWSRLPRGASTSSSLNDDEANRPRAYWP